MPELTEEISSEEVVVTTKHPKPRRSAQSVPRKQPRYAVVVLNDDLHTFLYVIVALGRVFGHSEQMGFELALEIHTKGRAVVWTGSLEVAELKRDQLRSIGPDYFGEKPVTFPLGVEIEPVD